MKHKTVLSTLLGPVCLCLMMTLGTSGGAKVPATVSKVQTAPALAQDDGEALRRSLLSRLEFEELSLQLIGVATFQGETSCFIKHPGSSEQMIYTVGDVIGGYRIASIDNQSVTFERQGTQFWLTLGESSNGTPVAPVPAPGAMLARKEEAAAAKKQPAIDMIDEPASSDDTVMKYAGAAVKVKTRRFQTAKLIEDGFAAIKTTGRGASDRLLALAGKGFSPAAPLRGELTSGYGYRRHPLGGGTRFHMGIDIAGPYGTSVRAAAAGRVAKVYNTPYAGYGRHVIIEHANGYETLYAHLMKASVSEGQWVNQGDVIGREGSSGNSTGPHLHFEIHKNKIALDPERFVHPDR